MAGSPGGTDGDDALDAAPLWFTLAQVGRRVGAGLRPVLAPLGLDPRQFLLLRCVAEHAGCSQQAVGASLRIPPSRMVDLVDGLEQRQLVQRVANPGDRRAHALVLTASGRRLLRRAGAAADRYEAALGAALSVEEQATLAALLERVAPISENG